MTRPSRWDRTGQLCSLGLPTHSYLGVGGNLREVAAELQLAAARPVKPVEGGLNQGRHDAAQTGLVTAAIALAVMFHAKPGGKEKVLLWVQTLEDRQMNPKTADPALTRNSDWLTRLCFLTMPLLLSIFYSRGNPSLPQILSTSL